MNASKNHLGSKPVKLKMSKYFRFAPEGGRKRGAVMPLWWKRPEKPSLQGFKRPLTYGMKTVTVP
jgi:hypothetical protein